MMPTATRAHALLPFEDNALVRALCGPLWSRCEQAAKGIGATSTLASCCGSSGDRSTRHPIGEAVVTRRGVASKEESVYP
jgi:hypothetical protein